MIEYEFPIKPYMYPETVQSDAEYFAISDRSNLLIYKNVDPINHSYECYSIGGSWNKLSGQVTYKLYPISVLITKEESVIKCNNPTEVMICAHALRLLRGEDSLMASINAGNGHIDYWEDANPTIIDITKTYSADNLNKLQVDWAILSDDVVGVAVDVAGSATGILIDGTVVPLYIVYDIDGVKLPTVVKRP